MKIGLIGGSGRLGTWLSPILATRHEVLVLDVNGADPVDALDRQAVARALRGCEAAVHLCVVVPRGAEAHDPGRVGAAWAVNVGSVAQTMLACADAGVSRFVHISSLSVFARAGLERIDEGQPADGLEPYGLSKRLGEQACSLLAPQLGISATSLRIGWPTPDDLAPRWLQPSTGEAVDFALLDGTAVPALAASELAVAIESCLAEPPAPGWRPVAVVADPASVFLPGR